jgi:simple sugar transport system ATP-binding protein
LGLSLENIVKRFGATIALDGVSLGISPGEIVGLVGENGAGKTTLMRVAAREIQPDSGIVHAPSRIGFVHQHFLLVNEFTVAENLELALGHTNTGDVACPPLDRRVADLSVGERAQLELVKAVARKPELLILDEPTSVLTPLETEALFATMRRLAGSGTAVVFISHKIREVVAVATRVVVMRKGRIVESTASMDAERIAQAMSVIPEINRASAGQPSNGVPALTFGTGRVAPGEIVAVIGVAGNGQTELASRLRDQLRPHTAAFIPEDRTRDGVIAEMSIAENFLLAGASEAAGLIDRFKIRTRGPSQRAGELSGGNQQKVVLARELSRRPRTIVAAEPTRGLDLESTRFVHDRLREAADSGAAVLLITSDLDEAFTLADAIHVIYRGRLSDRMTPSQAAEDAPRLMAGLA